MKREMGVVFVFLVTTYNSDDVIYQYVGTSYIAFHLANFGTYKKRDQNLKFEVCFSITDFQRKMEKYSEFCYKPTQ